MFQFPKESLNATSVDKQSCQLSTSKILEQTQNNRSYKRKSLLDLSDKQTRRRTELLVTENTIDELAFALKMKMKVSGNTDGAAIFSFLIKHSEETSKLRAFCECKKVEIKMHSKEQALALMLNLGLSRSKYEELRNISNIQGISQYILRIIKFDLRRKIVIP